MALFHDLLRNTVKVANNQPLLTGGQIMKIKHFTMLVLLSSALSGCSEKDLEYYKANPEQANQKWEECEKELKAAVLTKDKAEVEKILKDAECDAATKARKARFWGG